MLDSFRKTPFFIALSFLALAWVVEISSIGRLGVVSPAANALDVPTPGQGIPSLAFLDGMLVYTVLLIALSIFLPEGILGRVQGCATLIVSILVLIGDSVMIFGVLALLILMITLLLAPVSGTLAYIAFYAKFDTRSAKIALGLMITLKLIFAVFMVIAHQRFLQNKGLVLLVLTSLVATLLLGFLDGFVPAFLASIADAIGAVVVEILVALWAVFFLIGSLVSIVKAVT